MSLQQVEAAGFTIGDHVTYKPTGEAGRIIRFSHQATPTFCFVKYGSQQTPKATYLRDLERTQK